MSLRQNDRGPPESLCASLDLPLMVWLLRVCVAMTFFGHGCLATKTQPGWYAYLAVVGIGKKIGGPIMVLIGYVDIALSLCAIMLPSSALLCLLLCWCGVWGFATALMRPLSGESWLQFIERSGNWIPAILLLYVESQTMLQRDPEGKLQKDMAIHYTFYDYLILMAVICTAMLLVGSFMRLTGVMQDKVKSK